MPIISFDPPDESGMTGGALEGEIKSRYTYLCNLMTSKDPRLTIENYNAIYQEIMAIFKNDVIAHISAHRENYSDAYSDAYIKKVDEIFANASEKVINYQINTDLDPMFSNKIIKVTPSNHAINLINIINLISLDIQFILLSKPADLHEEYKKIKYPHFETLKERVINEHNTPYIKMIYINNLTLKELLDSYLNNVFYIGFSYKTEWVDCLEMTPSEFTSHDISHMGSYVYGCIPKSESINILKEFRNFVSTKDRPVKYSIDFVLFFEVHEDSCRHIESILNIHNMEKDNAITTVKSYLERNMYGLCDLQCNGMAIPAKYREKKDVIEPEDENKIKEEKVIEYLNLAAQRYVDCWFEFRRAPNDAVMAGAAGAANGSRGGARGVQKRRKTRQRKTRRKYHKSRRLNRLRR
jgi:hypothetical protein